MGVELNTCLAFSFSSNVSFKRISAILAEFITLLSTLKGSVHIN